METKKKRLTLDLDPQLQRRLKAVAALKGISMRLYCQAAIDQQLKKDEAHGRTALTLGDESLDHLARLQNEIPPGQNLPENSSEIISEAREQRAAAK